LLTAYAKVITMAQAPAGKSGAKLRKPDGFRCIRFV